MVFPKTFLILNKHNNTYFVAANFVLVSFILQCIWMDIVVRQVAASKSAATKALPKHVVNMIHTLICDITVNYRMAKKWLTFVDVLYGMLDVCV